MGGYEPLREGYMSPRKTNRRGCSLRKPNPNHSAAPGWLPSLDLLPERLQAYVTGSTVGYLVWEVFMTCSYVTSGFE